MQFEKAPNLYWALADLPRPYIDLRRALQGEKVSVNGMFAKIRAALKDPNLSPYFADNLEDIFEIMQILDGSLSAAGSWQTLRVRPSDRSGLSGCQTVFVGAWLPGGASRCHARHSSLR